MTRLILTLGMVCWLGMAPATAQQTTPDPGKVADYRSAEALEQARWDELQTIDRLSDRLWYASSNAAAATSASQKAQQAWQERAAALNLLPEKAALSRQLLSLAMEAIAAYHEAAESARAAISTYAGADAQSAESKARLADSALDRKKALQQAAAQAVTRALAAAEEVRLQGGNSLLNDEKVTRNLMTGKSAAAALLKELNRLAEQAKEPDAGLAAAAREALAKEQSAVEGFDAKARVVEAAEQKTYQPLRELLTQMAARDEARPAAIETYFSAVVYAAVASESYLFLAATQAAAGEQAQDELESAKLAVKTATAAAVVARQRVEEEARAAQKATASLTALLEKLPDSSAALEDLRAQSAQLGAGLEPLKKKIDQAVAEKRQAFAAAREAADQAYALAYGQKRQDQYRDSAAMAAAPKAYPIKANISVQEHVYSHVDAVQGEPEHYGAYTYVLFRQNYETAQPHVKQRYDALLEALKRSTSAADRFTAPIPKEKLNIFCIPYREELGYDADLARSYLATAGNGAILRQEIIGRLRNSPGPFLLTTRTRLSEGGALPQMLFADLSSYPADAFDSLLAAYKNTLVETPPAGQDVWIPPATQRVVYAGISVADAIPSLLENIKKLINFFAPADQSDKQ